MESFGFWFYTLKYFCDKEFISQSFETLENTIYMKNFSYCKTLINFLIHKLKKFRGNCLKMIRSKASVNYLRNLSVIYLFFVLK